MYLCFMRVGDIKFEAKAFQGPWDEEPVWKVYKVIDCPPSAEPKRSFSKPGEGGRGGAERVTGIDARWLYSNENYLVTSEDLYYCSLVFETGHPPRCHDTCAQRPEMLADPAYPPSWSDTSQNLGSPLVSSPLPSPPVCCIVRQGSFSRKLLDPKIITLEGTIYDVMGKMMWKRRVKSGKFTARRRPSRLSRGGGGASSSRRGTTPDREADERWGEGARATGDGSGGEGTRRKGKGKGKETGAGKGSRRTRSARPAGSGRSGRRDRDEL